MLSHLFITILMLLFRNESNYNFCVISDILSIYLIFKKWVLYKDDACYSKKILKAAPNKTAAVPLISQTIQKDDQVMLDSAGEIKTKSLGATFYGFLYIADQQKLTFISSLRTVSAILMFY